MLRFAPFTALAVVSVLAAAGCSGADPSDPTATSQDAVHGHKCHSNAQCSTHEFCDTEASESCHGSGVCASRGVGVTCPRSGDTVCGCNGTSYGNACLAHKGGASVAFDGTCSCAYAAENIDGDTVAEMPWADANATFFYTFTGNGTLQNDSGTFVVTIEPPCRRALPRCEIATREEQGTFTTSGSTLALHYGNGSSALFLAELDCHNNWRLLGNDWGQSVTLSVTTIAF